MKVSVEERPDKCRCKTFLTVDPGANMKLFLIYSFLFLVINIFLGSVLPVFHLDDSAVYVMIVYLLVLAAVVVFEIYLALMKAKDVSNHRILSKPQDDEAELTSAPFGQTQSDIKKVRHVSRVLTSDASISISISISTSVKEAYVLVRTATT